MSHYRYRSSRPDRWTSPRPPLDPAIRALAYGPVRPMHEASLLERILGLR